MLFLHSLFIPLPCSGCKAFHRVTIIKKKTSLYWYLCGFLWPCGCVFVKKFEKNVKKICQNIYI